MESSFVDAANRPVIGCKMIFDKSAIDVKRSIEVEVNVPVLERFRAFLNFSHYRLVKNKFDL